MFDPGTRLRPMTADLNSQEIGPNPDGMMSAAASVRGAMAVVVGDRI